MFNFIDTFIRGRSFMVNVCVWGVGVGCVCVCVGGAPPQLLIWKMGFPRALSLLQHFLAYTLMIWQWQ